MLHSRSWGYKGLSGRTIRRRLWYSRRPMGSDLPAIPERVWRSETLRSSSRLRDFLRYLVRRQTAEGQAKETLIGVEFFPREPAYDPRKDPIVRVEAHRLRSRLR